jgi:hypothetical protein
MKRYNLNTKPEYVSCTICVPTIYVMLIGDARSLLPYYLTSLFYPARMIFCAQTYGFLFELRLIYQFKLLQ